MTASKLSSIIALYWLALCQPACANGFLAMVNPATRTLPAENLAVTFSSQIFEANDYTSMRHFSDDWRGAYTLREGKNLGVSFARADVSAREASWSVGYFYRHDILLESNRDTTDLVYANKIVAPVPVGKNYDINLEMNGFEAHGVRLDKAVSWQTQRAWNATVGVGASLLKGQRTRMGQAHGNALSTATGYTYDLNMTDADSNKTYPFMPLGEVSSTGYALDLGLRLQWQDGKRLDLALNDLAGEIRWRNLPLTTMDANSSTATRDAQGYILFNPTVSGQNSRVDLTQKLDTKGSVQFHAPLSKGISANLGTEWIKDNFFPRLGLEYATSQGVEMMADYDTRFKTFGLGASWHDAYLTARTQNLNFDKSRGYGVKIGFELWL
ncbi:MAG: hypothetical protein ABL902_06785 [Gallionella sp.]